MDVSALNNLNELSLSNMSDFDKSRVEYKDVWWVEGDAIGSAFPFDDSQRTIWIAMPIDV
jgi:hypothetical protein